MGDQREAKPQPASHDAAPVRAVPDAIAGNVNDVLDRRAADRAALVDTKWWVDYSMIAGTSKKLPYRSGDDQLVVDELKIHPDGDGASRSLNGGNMAHSGDVLLGAIAIPATRGQVSASVRYAARAAFDIKLDLDKPTAAERKQLQAASAYAKQRAEELTRDLGDYAAIGTTLESELADRFPEKQLKVTVRPLGASGKASKSFIAKPAEYDATTHRKFGIMIDPAERAEHNVSWSSSTSGEQAAAHHNQTGEKVGYGGSSKSTKTEADEIVDRLSSSLATNTQDVAKKIETEITARELANGEKITKETHWTLGLGPAKDKKDDEKASQKPSTVSKIFNTVKLGAKFLYRHSLGKVIKFGGLALDVLGSLWGGITERGSIQRESVSSKESSEETKHSSSESETVDISHLSSIAVSKMVEHVSTHRSELTQEVETHVAKEVSLGHQDDRSHKETVSNTASGTTTTHEMDGLRLDVAVKD